MKIGVFNIVDKVEKEDLAYFNSAVEFFESKGFNVIKPNNDLVYNKITLKNEFEKILQRKPIFVFPTYCKKQDFNFIENVSFKKIEKSKTIICGNSFISPFLNKIAFSCSNKVFYGPNFISSFNSNYRENLYINLIAKYCMKNNVEKITLEEPIFFGKNIVKGNLVGGEISSFLNFFSKNKIKKLVKNNILLIDGHFSEQLQLDEIIKRLKKLKIFKIAKAFLICSSIIENKILMEKFLVEFKNFNKAKIVVGLKGMISDNIELLQLNKQIILDFKKNEIWQ